jgi:hypothetical protein
MPYNAMHKAAKFKSALKNTGSAVKDVAIIGGGMILTKKFLDAKVLFAKQIEKDPAYADKIFIKHQGAIKLIGGALAAGMVKNPLLKLALVGVAIEGFISEARTLTTNKDGVSMFEAIGTSSSEVDQEMLEAASTVKGFGEDYGTMVSGEVDLMNYTQSAVSGFGDDYGTMVSGF